jgi:hypothetical protein
LEKQRIQPCINAMGPTSSPEILIQANLQPPGGEVGSALSSVPRKEQKVRFGGSANLGLRKPLEQAGAVLHTPRQWS